MASKISATMSGTNRGSEVNATMVSRDKDGKRNVNVDPGQEGGFFAPITSKIGMATMMFGAKVAVATTTVAMQLLCVEMEQANKEDDNNGGD
jgi:hypothetical protein